MMNNATLTFDFDSSFSSSSATLCSTSFSCLCSYYRQPQPRLYFSRLPMGSSYSVVEYVQELDCIDTERSAKRAEKKRLRTSTTPAPPMVIAEDADLSVNNHISQSSEETNIDQSNNGFSFINIHWASFYTGLSSVLPYLSSSHCSPAVATLGDDASDNPVPAIQKSCVTSSLAPTDTVAPLHASNQEVTQAPLPQGMSSVPTPSFLSPSVAQSLPLPSTILPQPPLAASPVAPPSTATPLPYSTSRRPHRSPSRTSSTPATHKAIEFHQEGRSTGIHSLSR